MKTIDHIIQRNIAYGKPRIAFGLLKPHAEILNSLRRGQAYADITLVGPQDIQSIDGFTTVIADNPERRLAEMLYHGEVDGIIRGTIDDFQTYHHYLSLAGKDYGSHMRELTLLEDAHGRQFFLSEASNPGGWRVEEKVNAASAVADFMKDTLGMDAKIAVHAGVRHATYNRKKDQKNLTDIEKILNKTYEDAETVVSMLQNKGYNAANYSIDLSNAIDDGMNIVVPVNGMVGNQIFRSIVLLGGGKILTCSRIGLPHCYEDNSRREKDYEMHVKWLVAWINGQKHKVTTSIV